ncbi:hypothetical protein BH10BAC5_BH10BAC5_10670 [soil metagenome]
MKLVYNNNYVDLLNRSENELLRSLNGLSKERFYFKSSRDSWSIYECLIHILITEKNISKIIKLDSYSTVPLRQITGMEKIVSLMESPESLSAPELTEPNEENIKKLFEDDQPADHLNLEKVPGSISDFNTGNTDKRDQIAFAAKERSGKTYEVIFGRMGRRNLKTEKIEKKIYANSSREYHPEKSSPKEIKNPFIEKYLQQNDQINFSAASAQNQQKKDAYIYTGTEPERGKFSQYKNIKELLNLFISIRDELINYFLLNPDVNLNTFYFAHPQLGNLTKEEWLFYLAAHTNRHRMQIENIKIHLPFTI